MLLAGPRLAPVNQSVMPSFFTRLARRCCRNSSVLLKQLLTKWLWCVTCRADRLNTAGSHWEPQSRALHRPLARVAHAQRDPDHSKDNWPPSEPALEKLSASQQNKNKKVEPEYFAVKSCLLGLCSSPWPIRSFSVNPKQIVKLKHFLCTSVIQSFPGKEQLNSSSCTETCWITVV